MAETSQCIDRKLSVAPMMDWTDRHCRYFHRLLAPSALLYTEMVTTGAVLHGDRERLLGYNPEEHPLALQLGGSDPADLAECARIAQQRGYDEVNLNVGCPSDRVQRGRFGACLMLEPGLVTVCVRAMREAVDIPVTVINLSLAFSLRLQALLVQLPVVGCNGVARSEQQDKSECCKAKHVIHFYYLFKTVQGTAHDSARRKSATILLLQSSPARRSGQEHRFY